jgi:hypothetical protein
VQPSTTAPNLMVVEKDRDGNDYYKCAFNTQVGVICYFALTVHIFWHVNSLGGFENILKRMGPGNLDWFLHTMLFYHTRCVIEKQESKKKSKEDSSDSDSRLVAVTNIHYLVTTYL